MSWLRPQSLLHRRARARADAMIGRTSAGLLPWTPLRTLRVRQLAMGQKSVGIDRLRRAAECDVLGREKCSSVGDSRAAQAGKETRGATARPRPIISMGTVGVSARTVLIVLEK